MTQRNRVYDLIVGDYKTGNGIRITGGIPDTDGYTNTGLQIRFDISKTADTKRTRGNSATIEIYNLSREHIALLQGDYLQCTFSVGYADEGARVVADGNVVEVKTVKYGTDFVTQVRMGEGYSDLNHEKLKGIVSPGGTVQEVIEEIRKQMPNVARGAYTGTNLNNPIVFGWVLNGTPAEMLRKLCEAHNIEYSVSGGVLNVSDENGLYTKDTVLAPVISEQTGLIDAPFHTTEQGRKMKKDKKRRKGVQFKALLNTECIPGRIVKLESDFISGYYRINSTRFSGDFRGNDWYVECFTSEVEAQDLL
ncbi:hypothetical protein CNR37_00176 [Pseudomonas phage ventosus]|uniref:Tail protein n=1 Tax=Pseudomonas phage ventosus TaxID=2048980 RepID=A0A2H4P861_9CAUD|nr:hypothetical protein CNR37_00176 [Pseudomonas phage ventosus]